MEPNTGIYKNYNLLFGLTDEKVFSSVLGNDGSMWFGASGCLFHLYKKNKEKGIENIKADKISIALNGKAALTVLVFDKAGMLWAGTKNEGLIRYDPSLKTFKQYKGLPGDNIQLSNNTILSLCAISADSLLIGTKGNGLILLNPDSGKFKKIDFQKNDDGTDNDYSIVNTIYKDHENKIWVGTENGGLWQATGSPSGFVNYSDNDGLASMNIKQIVEDDKGQIWLSTNLGLEIIDPRKKRFVHFSEKDGLRIKEADYLIKTASGDLLRIDLNGLHIFHSSSINFKHR